MGDRPEIMRLRLQILDYNNQYYSDCFDDIGITNSEYDMLFAHLVELERLNPDVSLEGSPTQTPGHQKFDGFDTVKHLVPMLSIDNTYTTADIVAFMKRTKQQEFCMEHKIDGLSISLVYKDGQLVRAVTRGNGEEGDDVTANVRTIKAIPTSIPSLADVLEIRGEIYMSYSSFAALNVQREEDGEKKFANPRNAAAGSLKNSDPRVVASRKLSFFGYCLGAVEGLERDVTTQEDVLQLIQDMGCPIPPYQICESLEAIEEACAREYDKLDDYDHPIDGLVCKVNTLIAQEHLGLTGHAPRWCMAYKFPAAQVETKVLSVDVQVGKTGVLTPVANLEPVSLSGVTIRRVTLHNFELVKTLGVGVGCTVLLERAGEVIPHVIRVTKPPTEVFCVPDACPECGQHTIMGKRTKDGGLGLVAVWCGDDLCVARNIARLQHFVGKNQMNIDKVGDTLVEQLARRGMVFPSELYDLTKEDLLKLDKVGGRKADGILKAIETSKTQDLWRFMHSLSIPMIGKGSSKDLANKFKSITAFLAANYNQLYECVGYAKARSITQYMLDYCGVIDDLLEVGVDPPAVKEATGNQVLNGEVFVITGSFEKMKRGELTTILQVAGAKVTGSVSKKTTYVVVGENPGSKKDKAEALGTTIIDIWTALHMAEYEE